MRWLLAATLGILAGASECGIGEFTCAGVLFSKSHAAGVEYRQHYSVTSLGKDTGFWQLLNHRDVPYYCARSADTPLAVNDIVADSGMLCVSTIEIPDPEQEGILSLHFSDCGTFSVVEQRSRWMSRATCTRESTEVSTARKLHAPEVRQGRLTGIPAVQVTAEPACSDATYECFGTGVLKQDDGTPKFLKLAANSTFMRLPVERWFSNNFTDVKGIIKGTEYCARPGYAKDRSVWSAGTNFFCTVGVQSDLVDPATFNSFHHTSCTSFTKISLSLTSTLKADSQLVPPIIEKLTCTREDSSEEASQMASLFQQSSPVEATEVDCGVGEYDCVSESHSSDPLYENSDPPGFREEFGFGLVQAALTQEGWWSQDVHIDGIGGSWAGTDRCTRAPGVQVTAKLTPGLNLFCTTLESEYTVSPQIFSHHHQTDCDHFTKVTIVGPALFKGAPGGNVSFPLLLSSTCTRRQSTPPDSMATWGSALGLSWCLWMGVLRWQ